MKNAGGTGAPIVLLLAKDRDDKFLDKRNVYLIFDII